MPACGGKFVSNQECIRWVGLVSSPDPPHHAHFGKLEREKWKEGLVNGLTTLCSSAEMLAELIKT